MPQTNRPFVSFSNEICPPDFPIINYCMGEVITDNNDVRRAENIRELLKA